MKVVNDSEYGLTEMDVKDRNGIVFNRKIFLAEYEWGGYSQFESFTKEGIWKPVDFEIVKRDWENVEEGSLLILKHEELRQLRVRAVGIIISKEEPLLRVEWKEIGVDLYVGNDSVYKRSLGLLSDEQKIFFLGEFKKRLWYNQLVDFLERHLSSLPKAGIPAKNTTASNTNESYEHLEPLIEVLKNRGVYFFDTWRDSKKVNEVISSGEWKARSSLGEDVYTNVKQGDIIFLKSRPAGGDPVTLEIRAVGVVRSVLSQKHFKVDWVDLNRVKLNAPDDDAFLSPFIKIQEIDLHRFFGEIIGVLPSFPERFQRLVSGGDSANSSNENVLQLIKQNLNKKEHFWWYTDRDRNWSESSLLKPGNTVLVRLTKPASCRVGELVLICDTNQLNLLVGIFEIVEINEAEDGSHSDLFCKYLYEFQDEIFPDNLVLKGAISAKEVGEFLIGDILEISEDVFGRIINVIELKLDETRGTYLKTPQPLSKSGYNSDWAYTETDLLGIENDVRAFALLLASRNVNPPLAIALFGRWGSGKSFFMRHLEKRIKELSQHQRFLNKDEMLRTSDVKNTETEFCQGIAHIWFNAWSYLDANLWAGLAHSLFQKLNEYISNTTSGEIERLKIQVRIAKRLQLLHGDLQNYTEKKASLEELKKKLEREKAKRIANFFSSKYDQKILNFCKENGLPESAAKQMTPEALKEKIEIGTNLFRYFKRNIWQLIIVGAVVVAFLFVEELLSSLIDAWKPILESVYTKVLTVVTPIIVPVASFYKRRAGVVKELLNNISELASKEESNDKELEQLKKEIEEIDPIIHEIEESIHREYSLNPDITQLAIANFISSKSDQKEYIDRLGIVSVIRKDFETLSDLFYTEDGKDQEKAADEADTESKSEKQLREDRAYISKHFNQGQKLERIILYIDDLDRCSDAKVLEVVQAVHLLMAFPLFNVVVGVDKRCLHNALNYQYMLRYSEYKDTDDFFERIKEVKPEEYIEKIFQIPFQLKDASNSSIKSFIDDLLKDQIATDSVDVVPPSSLSAEKTRTEKVEKAKEEVKPNSAPKVDDTPSGKERKELLSDEVNSKIVAPKDLRLTKVELDLLKEIAWLLGKSPRTIKRFINIYRLIRAHEHLSYDDENKHDDFLSVMFFLALNIGVCRAYAEVICESLKDRSVLLSDAFDKVPKLKKVKDQISKNDALKKLLTFNSDRLLTYSEFVHRFSFSRVNEVNELEAITE